MKLKKNQVFIFIGMLCLCISTVVAAAPNKNANQKAHDNAKCSIELEDIQSEASDTKDKVSIAHCGCNSDGNGLEWKVLNVSNNAKGHRNHVEGHDTFCSGVDDEGNDSLNSFSRGADDCAIDGDGSLLEYCSDELNTALNDAEEAGESVSCELIVEEPPVEEEEE